MGIGSSGSGSRRAVGAMLLMAWAIVLGGCAATGGGGGAAGPVIPTAQPGSDQAAPVIDSVSPRTGQLVGGTAVTITGSAFAAGAVVMFGEEPATDVVVADPRRITCRAPAGERPGAVEVRVRQSSGSATAGPAFSYLEPPRVLSVEPGRGPLTGGTVLTIRGARFAGQVTVRIGGVPAAISEKSDTRIVCTAPAGAQPGAAEVAVESPELGSSVPERLYAYGAPPELTAVAPARGPTVGGTAVRIDGSGFDGTMTVRIGGAVAQDVAVNDARTQITCTSPAGSPGAQAVQLVSTLNGTTTAAGAFTYFTLVRVDSVSPADGPLAGGTPIEIRGVGLASVTAVTIDGAPATVIVADSDGTRLTCRTPAATLARTVDLVLTPQNEGPVSIASAFTYNPRPVVASVTPPSGSQAGGTIIRMFGANFRGDLSATIAGRACTSLLVDTTFTQLDAVTPPGLAIGPASLVVSSSTHGTSQAVTYTYSTPLTLSGVSPNEGPVAGGQVVTVSGTGFAGTVNVTFGNAAATGVTVNTTLDAITCTTPAQPAGPANVIVRSSLNGTQMLGGAYTYRSAPTIASVAPPSGPLAGGTVITIGGANYFGTPSVTVGGTACTAVSITGTTTVTATTPMSATGTGAKDVCLTMSVSGAVTATGGFTYNPAPTLTAVTPDQGPVAGANVIMIEGTGYGTGLQALIAGVPCTGLSVTGTTTITCTVPASQSGAGAKTLTIGSTSNGTQTFAGAYSYRNLPTIQSIAPPSGPLAGLSTIQIGGTNFFGTPGVTIDGRACTALALTGSTTVTATTPSSLTGVGAKDVVVTMSASGTVTQTGGYTYNPLPTLQTVTPNEGPVAGGNVILIDGDGFGGGANALIQGVACTGLSVNASGTQITCTVPASQSGAGAKNLTIGSTLNGTQTFNGVYSYRNPPTITSIAPPSGPVAGGTTITIGGTSFFGTPTVFVDGTTCTNVTVTTVPTTITAVTPMSGSGAGARDVVVTMSASGTVTQTNGFTYNPAMTITDVFPPHGSTTGGALVLITGTNFQGDLNVLFGSGATTGVTVNATATAITCVSPAGTPGPVDVIVLSSTHGGVTRTAGFEYLPPSTPVSFTAPTTVTAPTGFAAAGLADFDADGRVDLAEGNVGVTVFANTTTPGATEASFTAGPFLVTPGPPGTLVAGDFNADFKPDLAVRNGTTGGGGMFISIYPNATPAGGPMAFGAETSIAPGTDIEDAAVADLNGDARPDVVWTNFGGSAVNVVINTTAPGAMTFTFDPMTTVPFSEPIGVALADFNLDGRPDLAITSNTFACATAVNQTPAGATSASFTSTVTLSADAELAGVADFNGDGRPDVLVDIGLPDRSLGVFLNETAPGAATLSFSRRLDLRSTVPATVVNDASSAVAADVNGDGRPDIVVTRVTDSVRAGTVYLNETPPGASTAAFAAEQQIAVNSSAVVSGDLNLDGRPDLVFTNTFAASALQAVVNDSPFGTASVQLGGRVDFATGAQPVRIALDDVNRDGRVDVATADRASGDPGTSTILLNNAAVGGLIPDLTPTLAVTVNVSPLGIALTDVNGDGARDLLTATDTPTSTVAVLFNATVPGTTTIVFGAQTEFTVTSTCTALAVPDVDGDGRPDLVTTTTENDDVSVRLNTTATGAASPSYGAAADFDVAGTGGAEPLVADLNGDFLPDLVVPNGGNVSVLLNATAPGSATASFGVRQDIAVGTLLGGGVVCDLNRDGRPDVAVADRSGNVVWVLLNQTPAGAAAVTFAAALDFPAAAGANAVCAADFTGDGALDLAVGGTAASIGVFRNTMAPGAATASFAARTDFATGSPPVSCAARDVNGDGKPDLVVGNAGANTVSIRLNTR